MPRVQLVYPGNTLCSHEITVSSEDLSQAAHLGFDRLVNIIHGASDTFLRNLGIYITGRRKFHIIFADLTVQYLSEAFEGDNLEIDMAMGETSSKGFEICFKVINQTRSMDVALARIGALFFDYDKRCTVEIPDGIKATIERKTAPKDH